MSLLNLHVFANLISPLIVIYEMLQIADNDCFHQRVVFFDVMSVSFDCGLYMLNVAVDEIHLSDFDNLLFCSMHIDTPH